MTALNDIVPSGVVTGDNLRTLMEYCREKEFALPAVNCTRYVFFSWKDASDADRLFPWWSG